MDDLADNFKNNLNITNNADLNARAKITQPSNSIEYDPDFFTGSTHHTHHNADKSNDQSLQVMGQQNSTNDLNNNIPVVQLSRKQIVVVQPIASSSSLPFSDQSSVTKKKDDTSTLQSANHQINVQSTCTNPNALHTSKNNGLSKNKHEDAFQLTTLPKIDPTHYPLHTYSFLMMMLKIIFCRCQKIHDLLDINDFHPVSGYNEITLKMNLIHILYDFLKYIESVTPTSTSIPTIIAYLNEPHEFRKKMNKESYTRIKTNAFAYLFKNYKICSEYVIGRQHRPKSNKYVDITFEYESIVNDKKNIVLFELKYNKSAFIRYKGKEISNQKYYKNREKCQSFLNDIHAHVYKSIMCACQKINMDNHTDMKVSSNDQSINSHTTSLIQGSYTWNEEFLKTILESYQIYQGWESKNVNVYTLLIAACEQLDAYAALIKNKNINLNIDKVIAFGFGNTILFLYQNPAKSRTLTTSLFLDYQIFDIVCTLK